MKAMKRLFALLLALTMVFGLAVTGFAAGETSGVSPKTKGTIKITNPDKDTTYNAYRLLDLESWSVPNGTDPDNPDPNTNGNYSYKLNEEWREFFEQDTIDTVFVEISDDGQDYVTWKKNADEVEFAELAIAWAKSHEVTESNPNPTPNAIDPEAWRKALDTNELTLTTDGNAPAAGNDQLPLGWYLVDTSLGALCSLGTTDNTAEITEKNEETTELKEVKEKGDTEVWYNGERDKTAHSDTDIGSTVEFKATITAKDGAEGYIFHDKMDAALAFDATKVKVYKLDVDKTKDKDEDGIVESSEWEWEIASTGNALEAVTSKDDLGTAGNDNHYWLNTKPTAHTNTGADLDNSNTCTFEIEFSQEFLDTLSDDDHILITYEAKLTDAAQVDTDIKNHSRLEYGQGNFTTDSSTKTRTHELNIWKYWNDSNKTEDAETALKDAEFVLYKEGTTEDTYSYLKVKKGENDNFYHPKNDQTEDTPPVDIPDSHWTIAGAAITDFYDEDKNDAYIHADLMMKTATDGFIRIDGLDAGTYFLHETKAPAGFNKLEGDIKIVIANDGTVTWQQLDSKREPLKDNTDEEIPAKPAGDQGGEHEVVKVVNNYGREMPATGGIGTTLFYVIGSIMVIGAAVILITKKRVNM